MTLRELLSSVPVNWVEFCSGYLSPSIQVVYNFDCCPWEVPCLPPKGCFLAERNLGCPRKEGLFQKTLDRAFRGLLRWRVTSLSLSSKASKAPRRPLRTIKKSIEPVSDFSEPQDPRWCLVMKGILHEWELFWGLPTKNTGLLCSLVWEIHTTPSLPREAAIVRSGCYFVNGSFGRVPTQANKRGNQIGPHAYGGIKQQFQIGCTYHCHV